MNELILFFIIIASGFIGYLLGRYHRPEDGIIYASDLLRDKARAIIKERPKPGVVRHLTDSELADKRDPVKRGNKESFDKFFANNPIKPY